MNTNKQAFDKMMKIAGTFLKSDYLEKLEMEKVENDFIDGFYKVLRVALDVSINDTKFTEFVNSGQKEDAVATASFLIETLDNEKTYTLMNYYLMNFLLAFVKSLSITQDETLNRPDSFGSGSWGKGAKKESIAQIQTMLANENLVPVGFATVSENYKNLTGKTS